MKNSSKNLKKCYAIVLVMLVWNHVLMFEMRKREKAEAELKSEKENSQSMSEFRNKFLSKISHEIRTPLNAINGLIYLLEKTDKTKVQEQYIVKIKNSSKNLGNVVNNILDYSKIESGNIGDVKEPFNIDDVLEDVKNVLMHKIDEKNLIFKIKKDTLIKKELIGDQILLEQAIINLVDNAIKFTDKGSISLEMSLISKIKNKCRIKFVIKDTGIGIDQNDIKRLFLPFNQLDFSITRKYDGNGLGLSIADGFVKILGGKIEVESIKGKGSVFSFVIPFDINPEDSFNAEILPNLNYLKVILIDSDIESRSVIFEYLDSFHMNVDIVDTIDEGKERILQEENSYEICLINLSVIKNFEKIEKFIKIAEDLKINIMMMVDSVNEEKFNFLKKDKMIDIIVRPIVSSALYNRIIESYYGKDLTIYNDNADEEESFSKNLSVLLVEDNEMNQLIEKEILNQGGYNVIIANNGKIAVEIMKNDKKNIDLILMDIHMPVMDGIEATKKIRDFNNDIPIIIMTADSFYETSEKFDKTNISGYIMKPVDQDKLFEEISNALEKASESIEVPNEDLYLDMKQGMNRVGNKKDFYLDMLKIFFNDMASIENNVGLLIKDYNYEEARKMLHKIKGCAGNIAAIKLYESSNFLMNTLKSDLEVDVGPYLWEFDNDMKITLDIIKKELEENNQFKEPDTNTDADEKFMKIIDVNKSSLKKLIKLLRKFDLDAIKIYEDLKKQGVFKNGVLGEVEKSIKDYKFTEAADILENNIK